MSASMSLATFRAAPDSLSGVLAAFLRYSRDIENGRGGSATLKSSLLERIGPTCVRQSRRMQVALATPKRFGISNDERQLGERARSYARTSYPLLKRLIA